MHNDTVTNQNLIVSCDSYATTSNSFPIIVLYKQAACTLRLHATAFYVLLDFRGITFVFKARIGNANSWSKLSYRLAFIILVKCYAASYIP